MTVDELWTAHRSALKVPATTGYDAHAATTGDEAIAVAVGRNSTAKAGLKGWMVLAQYTDAGNLVDVRSLKVGDNGIEPNKWYRIDTSGSIMEVEQ